MYSLLISKKIVEDNIDHKRIENIERNNFVRLEIINTSISSDVRGFLFLRIRLFYCKVFNSKKLQGNG